VLAASVIALGLSAVQVRATPTATPTSTAPAEDQLEARRILVMLRIPPDHHQPNAVYGGDYGDAQTIAMRRRLAQKIAERNRLEFLGDGWQMQMLGVDCYVMRVHGDETVDGAIKRVEHDPDVAWSEPMHIYRAQRSATATDNDPLFALQPTAVAWRLADLHRVATGRGVVVAVVDSRIELDHPDLAGQFVTSQDFVAGRPGPPERHGTGVAGVIAAKMDNGLGIAGVAPGARLMALRACWQTDQKAPSAPTLCDSLSLAKALYYAIAHRAAVINLSLAGPPDRLLAQLIEIALRRDITVVAAYDPSLPKGGFPASQPHVIAVANQSLPLIPPGVYSAPGDDVPTTQPGGEWILVNGSSYAAAQVSGLVALVREGRSNLANPILVATLRTGGPVDACATLSRASKPCGCTCPGPARSAFAAQ
jgi:hypothetical protein